MNYTKVILTLSSLILLSGCSDSEKKSAIKEPLKIIEVAPMQAPTKKSTPVAVEIHTMENIYNTMCIECHSDNGTGNTEKLTPSMEHLSKAEMITALKEVEADQGHIIMEHNRGEILKMGMEYHAEDMAEYMFKRFNK